MGKTLYHPMWKNVLSSQMLQRKHLSQTFSRAAAATTTAVLDDTTSASAKSMEQIPGFRSLPFIGTSWVLWPVLGKYSIEEPHIYDRDKYLMFGDIARDIFGGTRLISVYNEKDIETVLRNESKHPERGFLASLHLYRQMRKEWYKSVGVLLTQGKEWYNLRLKLQRHLMKPKEVDHFIEPMLEVTVDLTDRILQTRDRNFEIADITDEFFKWSLESIYHAALGERLGCLDVHASSNSDGEKMIRSVQTALACMNKLENTMGNSLQIWKYVPTPTWRKFVKAKDCFSEIAYRHIQRTVEKFKTSDSDSKTLSFLHLMMSSKDVEPHEAMTMTIDMLMGGVDTVAFTSSFLLFNLAKNPDKQQKLYEEITKLLPSPTDKLTAEAISEMRYLKLCLKETLRLYPPARVVGRVTEKDLVLSGYHIPKGTTVFCQVQACSRLEKFFEQPDEFIPERWAERENKPSPFIYLPFGFGMRNCIGRRIAELEMFTLVAEIVRRFKVEYHYEDFKLRNRLVNISDRPLKFTFIDRS